MPRHRASRPSSTFQFAILVFLLVVPLSSQADEITDWNVIMLRSIKAANTNGVVATRVMGITSAAVFDTVNGFGRRLKPVHADFRAPEDASLRAAAVEAAYVALVNLYPSQSVALLADRTRSLNAIAAGDDDADSIAVGTEFGRQVALDILAWRSTDGFTAAPSTFNGAPEAPGRWRPTSPPVPAPNGVGPYFATMETWVIDAHDQFRVGAPYAIDSAEYAADLNETRLSGGATTATADQIAIAKFWNQGTVGYWNRLARQLSSRRRFHLRDNALLFGMLNIAMADAAIACWDTKYTYVYWRPVTAIHLADTDANDATTRDDGWQPVLGVTPAHPEYISGHSTISAAAAVILQSVFGNEIAFELDSDTIPPVVRRYTSIQQANDEVSDARVFGGIHFRAACSRGAAAGARVGKFVIEHGFTRVTGQEKAALHRHGAGLCAGDGEVRGNED